MSAKPFLLAAPLALLLSGTSALALTADQVWTDLQALASEGGMAITAATELREDGMIVLNGVNVGPAGEPAALTIAEMSIEGQDDGSVAFFPTDIKINAGPQGSVTVEDQELSVSVFEDEGGLGYAVFADLLKIGFDFPSGSGAEAASTKGSVAFEALEASYGRAADGMTVDLTAGRLAYDIAQVDPALMLDQAQTSETESITLSGRLDLPEGVDLATLDAPGAFTNALNAGLAMSLEMSQGLSRGTLNDRSPMLPVSVTFEAQPATTALGMDRVALSLRSEAPGLSAQVTPMGMPEAIPVSMDNLSFSFAMPVVAPEGGEYQFGMKLGNLVLGDAAWAMFDPSGSLPREPADLSIDLGGQMKMDLAALMAADSTGATPPLPEPLTLELRELGLKLAGAVFAGTGSFTFDNALLAMGGPPMPVGTADLRLEGGNRLIDALIAAGLMTQEDAMGARMMMAMFGQSAGDDVLTSKIEAREGGSIFVNGQQIQ